MFGAMLLFSPDGIFLGGVVLPPCGVPCTHKQVRLFVGPLLGPRSSFPWIVPKGWGGIHEIPHHVWGCTSRLP